MYQRIALAWENRTAWQNGTRRKSWQTGETVTSKHSLRRLQSWETTRRTDWEYGHFRREKIIIPQPSSYFATDSLENMIRDGNSTIEIGDSDRLRIDWCYRFQPDTNVELIYPASFCHQIQLSKFNSAHDGAFITIHRNDENFCWKLETEWQCPRSSVSFWSIQESWLSIAEYARGLALSV